MYSISTFSNIFFRIEWILIVNNNNDNNIINVRPIIL